MIECALSRRNASILLVAGEIRTVDHDALRRLHDQLPHPRATLWWESEAFGDAGSPVTLAASDDPAGPYRYVAIAPQGILTLLLAVALVVVGLAFRLGAVPAHGLAALLFFLLGYAAANLAAFVAVSHLSGRTDIQ